jgi:hypothetical protein
MKSKPPRGKVEAIPRLREAAQAKVRAEDAYDIGGTPPARDALLTAQLKLESTTQDAIEVCHECGHDAADGHSHAARSRVSGRTGNVVHVDFRRDAAVGPETGTSG